MLSPNCIWLMGDERLADLGALLVFRHWLRCQLDELAAVSLEAPASGLPLAQQAPISEKEPGSYGRLFF